MKCPKCGYTSFDYLDSCKKCNHGLTEFKAKYGLRSLLFPHRTQQAALSAPLSEAATAGAVVAAAVDSGASSDFGYDFLSDSAAESAPPRREPQAASATDSFDFDADWNDEPVEAAAPPLEPQVASATDSFDFDADWNETPAKAATAAPGWEESEGEDFDFMAEAATTAPAAAPAVVESGSDTFDFMAETPAAESPAMAEDGLNLDLGDLSDPLVAAVEEPVFEFNASWDEAAPEEIPALAATAAGEEPLPEFAAEPLAFGDEFDFADSDLPELSAAAANTLTDERKPGPKEGPSDPFDHREPALTGPAPAAASLAADPLAVPVAAPAPHLGDQDAGAEVSASAEFPRVAEFSPRQERAGEFQALSPARAEADTPPLDLAVEEAEEPGSPPLRPAGAPFFRLGAGALDLLLLGVIYALFLAAGKLALFPADQAMAPISAEALLDLAIPYFLILFALCFGYFTLFHFLSGQTPGKMVFRLKVESVAGQPIDFAQAFLRSVGGLISLLCAGIGFLFMLRDPDHRGWNDQLAGTRVAETDPSPLSGG